MVSVVLFSSQHSDTKGAHGASNEVAPGMGGPNPQQMQPWLAGALLALRADPYPPRGPVIGILTQDAGEDLAVGAARTYIAASYVKWLESAGAR